MLAILGGGLLLLGVREGLLLLGLSSVFVVNHRERQRKSARRIQRWWLAKSRSMRIRRNWRNRYDPTSVMGRVTAWDNQYRSGYDEDTTQPWPT